ncbi:tRNA (guanosine(46)-N7)-methyltransferase TrmB [Halovulum sp. GXIMD14793]
MAENNTIGDAWRNLYGRRKGKPLRPAQRGHLQDTLPAIRLENVSRTENPERHPLDLSALFGDRPVWLEIGFGSGEHLLHIAGLQPDVNFIGCEPFLNGVAKLTAGVARHELDNVRVHPGDARDLLDVLPIASVQRVYLLYPDPWPKRRHHRRRFMNTAQIDQVSRVLARGGELRLATDIGDYVRQALTVMQPRPDFEWLAGSPSDWRQPWADWLPTRYETKAKRAGRPAHYLIWKRCGQSG